MVSRARRRRRTNLPAETTSFVGRRRELSSVRQLLRDHRLVTLTGVAGVGKSRLALRAAAQVQRGYPDGAWLVELADLQDPALLGETVLATLGVVDLSTRPAAVVLGEYLADRRLLLVLDNCEHLVGACARLVEALLRAAPGLRVLATSRERLRASGEHLVEVAPLPVPAEADSSTPVDGADALRLFQERAAAAAYGFSVTADNAATVARLCGRLDGIPLAIELAAVRVRTHTVEQILDRLDDRFRLLTVRSGGRHRSLEAAIEWSAETCTKPERLLWARLSVFAGFDVGAAEWVCADDEMPREEVQPLLAELVDKSVLIAGVDGSAVRYRWLDALREYGRRMLAGSGEEAALRRRHRDYVLGLARPLGAEVDDVRGQGAAFGRLLAENADLRLAFDYCLTEPGEGRSALDLAATLVTFWLGSGSLAEGRYWLRQALARDPGPSRDRARALWALGWLAIEQGDVVAAEAVLAESRTLATHLADDASLAWAIALSGYAALFAGDLRRAVRLLDDGLARHRRLGHPTGLLATMSGLAQATSYLGDPRSAAISAEQLAVADRHGWAAARASALWHLALETYRLGRLPRATELAQESLRLWRCLKYRFGIARCLDLLGWAAQAQGQADRAARLLGAARAERRRIGASAARPYRQRTQECAALVRRALGADRFAAEYRRGEELGTVEAVSLALDERAGTDGPATPAAGSPLTRRESQVAELVARGMSNRQIADTLVISPRTAESHVESILVKLGLTARTQVAAWLHGQVPR